MELYIHIPYCRRKCKYCNFASYAGQELTMPPYVEAVLAEAASLPCKTPLTTAFLGGGTPSVLPPELLRWLLNGLHRQYAFTPRMEFTAEANPDTLTEEWLQEAIAGGVNRLSFGMQAYQPQLLWTLGRIHEYEQVVQSVQLARRAGIDNISLDLMFGLPGQTVAMWRETLDAALALEPQHLSCYGLIPEEGTPLKQGLDAGRISLPDEDDERRMYDDALNVLAKHGFQQYEISNFALPGYKCRHNIGYWRQEPYIGLGASAASMLPDASGYIRTTNPAGISEYLDMIKACDWHRREVVRVSPADARFETLMLGLRMTDGVPSDWFKHLHGLSLYDYCGSTLESLADRGLLTCFGSRWRLTRRGMDVQNAVLVEILEAVEP